MDDRTIVFAADPTFGKGLKVLAYDARYILQLLSFFVFYNSGNIFNFNVGASVNLNVHCRFWARLAGTYGIMFHWKEKVSCDQNHFVYLIQDY